MSGRYLLLLLAALWLGSGAFLMFAAAPAAFAAAPDRTTAANVVGEMLRKWHYLALAAPLVLLIAEWRGGFRSNLRLVLLSVAIVFAASEALVDIRIRRIRSDSVISISELPKSDPVRRQFGMLHGVSSLLMLLQVVAAAGVLYGWHEPPATPDVHVSASDAQ